MWYKLFHPDTSNTLFGKLACVALHKRLQIVYSANFLEDLQVFSTSCKVPGRRVMTGEVSPPKQKKLSDKLVCLSLTVSVLGDKSACFKKEVFFRTSA